VEQVSTTPTTGASYVAPSLHPRQLFRLGDEQQRSARAPDIAAGGLVGYGAALFGKAGGLYLPMAAGDPNLPVAE